MGHKYMGHNYIGHNYTGHNYIGRACFDMRPVVLHIKLVERRDGAVLLGLTAYQNCGLCSDGLFSDGGMELLRLGLQAR